MDNKQSENTRPRVSSAQRRANDKWRKNHMDKVRLYSRIYYTNNKDLISARRKILYRQRLSAINGRDTSANAEGSENS